MKIYTDNKWYEHTEESLIEFMWKEELERRIKMWDLVIK